MAACSFSVAAMAEAYSEDETTKVSRLVDDIVLVRAFSAEVCRGRVLGPGMM